MLRMLSVITLLCIWLPLPAAQPLQFAGGLDSTEWTLSGSVFECRFAQQIPDYGRGVFYHQAGEDVYFQLETTRNLMDYSQAQVSILPPYWQPSGKTEFLGTSKISRQQPVLSLDHERTNRFLHALMEGKWPTISHKAYYDDERFVQIQLSSLAFDDFYLDYLECVKQLLPVNFDQVARSKVFFGEGEKDIDKPDMEVLDTIIFYMKNDPRVFAAYLDGHSDNQGRRYDQRQISKARVEDVERYFIKQGIDPEMITTRFHGGRYPVASNKSRKGRAENRRVTIRLEQRTDMPIPDHLLFKLPPRTDR